MGLGFWGTRWVESQLSLRNLDPSLLMWDMRRNLVLEPLPRRKCTIQFQYPELADARRRTTGWWSTTGSVDLCAVDPASTSICWFDRRCASMTAIWMGIATMRREIETGSVELDGDPTIASSMQQWLGLSPFAKEPSRVG